VLRPRVRGMMPLSSMASSYSEFLGRRMTPFALGTEVAILHSIRERLPLFDSIPDSRAPRWPVIKSVIRRVSATTWPITDALDASARGRIANHLGGFLDTPHSRDPRTLQSLSIYVTRGKVAPVESRSVQSSRRQSAGAVQRSARATRATRMPAGTSSRRRAPLALRPAICSLSWTPRSKRGWLRTGFQV
jgi:hypothetical protein